MRYLFDTHALLWWWDDDRRLPARVGETIAEPDNELFVSAASSWEIATKFRLGRPGFSADAHLRHHELLAAGNFVSLSITIDHARRAGSYDIPHRDPFDRMLAAQSELENLPLISCDAQMPRFPITLFW